MASDSGPASVLCLGFDAANPHLLRRWALEGHLPHLAGLMERGITGEVEGLRGFYVGSTWASMYTGVSPARHGLHYLVQLEPGTYRFHRPADHGLIWTDPFWTHLSQAGRRVAILDVPLTRLDPTLNGVQTVEWGGHDSVYGFQATPPGLRDEILDRFGPHPLGPSCDGIRRKAADYEDFLAKLEAGIRTKTALTRHLLGQGDWDLFMQVFTESHCVGHQCWHLHDRDHPAHDGAVSEITGDPLLRVYREMDAALGEILRDAGNAWILVFTAHGMEHRFGGHVLLKDILFRLGLAAPEETPVSPLRRAWRRLPRGIRRSLGTLRDRLGPSPGQAPGDGLPSLGVDVARSLCFAVPNGLAVGGIRLNLKGREPRGMVPPEEAEALCRDVAERLLAIRRPGAEGPLIRSVARTADLYEGEHLERLPDLLVEWDDALPLGSTSLGDGTGATLQVSSRALGTLEGTNDYPRSGEHRPLGLFVAAGPGTEAGTMDRPVSLMDLAPTLTRRLGVELPDSDGETIPELAP